MHVGICVVSEGEKQQPVFLGTRAARDDYFKRMFSKHSKTTFWIKKYGAISIGSEVNQESDFIANSGDFNWKCRISIFHQPIMRSSPTIEL